MMSSEEFSSTEELYERSPAEPTHVDHPESHMRYYENVVYVPHVLSPVMLVEYAPVLYNYVTYEPYLMNRFEVVYVPFFRQAAVTYLAPYYLQTQEFFSSSTENEYDTPSNSYPEISLDDVISDDLDDIHSTTSLSDVTSVLSLPRSDSSNSYEHTEFSSSTQESCESLQGFLCCESNNNLNSKCHDENNSAQEYPEIYFTEVDADVGIDDHASNSSLVFVDDEKEPNDLDYPGDNMHQISFHEDHHIESDDVSSISLSDDTKKPGSLTGLEKVEASSIQNTERGRNISPETNENPVFFYNDIETFVSSASSLEHVDKCLDGYGLENQEWSPLKHEKILHQLDCTGNYLIPASFHEDHHIESDVLSPSLFTDAEKTGGLTDSVKIEASSMKNIEKGKNISPERSENHVDFDNAIETFVSSASSLEYADKCLDEYGLEDQERSPLEEKKIPNKLDCIGNYLIPISCHEADHVESDISSPSLLTDAKKPGDLTDSAKVEASSLKNVAKDRNTSPERRENHTIFDRDMEFRVSSSLVYAESCQDENGFEHSQLLSDKNKNVKSSDSPSSPPMPVSSQETPLQNSGSLPKIDAIVPDPFDDANSEKETDSDDDPTISLQDILASEEYCRLRREQYFHKRCNTQLYRSALEGDIHPRRSLPEVGTLATIFEDLPYPINDPYDDGRELDQESAKEEYFDLPPLEVERSKSSHTTLLPKKKRFRNTRKFFSGLFRCFKPR